MKPAVFLSLLATGLAARTPSISWSSGKQEVNIGSSVELDCLVQYAQDYPVLWIKRGEDRRQDFPITSGPNVIIRNPRVTIKHAEGSGMYTLQISDVQGHDEGTYTCTVLLSRKDRITADVDLLVRRPPVIFDNSSSSVGAAEGESVELSCYAGGTPTPTISWRRENNLLLPNGLSVYRGNVLPIENIGKDDRGTYYCIADNRVGRGARKDIYLEVEFTPVIKALTPSVSQVLQGDAYLACLVEAHPHAAITWTYEQSQIINNQNYSVSQFVQDDYFTIVTLTVMDVQEHQFGNYSCTAANKLGQSSATVTLDEMLTTTTTTTSTTSSTTTTSTTSTTPATPTAAVTPECDNFIPSGVHKPRLGPHALRLFSLFVSSLMRN